MKEDQTDKPHEKLPTRAAKYIDGVIKKMRYRRKIRREVQAELTAHFADAIAECANDAERERKTQELIDAFGDPVLLGVLMRRAKKRCRPLWRKVAVRSLQATGVLVLYVVVCAARLFIGSPNIRVDYVAWLTEHSKAGRDEALNAKPLIDQAAALLGDKPRWPDTLKDCHGKWPGDMNDVQRTEAARVLAENQGALDLLKKAVERPSCWTDYRSVLAASQADKTSAGRSASAPTTGLPTLAQDVAAATMEYLPPYRQLAQRLALRAGWQAYNGAPAEALHDSVALQKFGVRLEGHGLLIEQLVGIAVEALGRKCMYTVLDRVDVPSEVLAHTQSELEKEYAARPSRIRLDAEKAFLYDYIQHGFTDDGKGSGRVLKYGLPLVTDSVPGALSGLLLLQYPDRCEVTARVDKLFGEIDRHLALSPAELAADPTQNREASLSTGYLLVDPLIPAYERIATLIWRAETDTRALATTLAVLRHKKERDAYPDSLDELVSRGHLKEVPIDPYTGKPLIYKRTDQGFQLYSVGEDLKDDGGKLGTDRKGKPRMWADNGDWVFWPVPDIPPRAN